MLIVIEVKINTPCLNIADDLMKKDNLISIVMPSFNSSKYISRSINSVQRQSWNNFELIIVDDASTDDTCNIVQTQAQYDDRICLVELSENKGPAVARNTAIEAAEGRYIAFLDSDDCWHENKLAIQVEAMKASSYPLSCTGYVMQRSNGEKKEIIPPSKISADSLLSGCDIGCLTAMIDLSVLGKKIYMRDIRMRQDMLLWIDVIREGGEALGIAEVLATLNMRDESLTSNKLSAAKYQWKTYRNELEMPLLSSAYYFTRYAFHGMSKHRF